MTEQNEHGTATSGRGFTRRRVVQAGAAATGLVVADLAGASLPATAADATKSASRKGRHETSFDASWRFLPR